MLLYCVQQLRLQLDATHSRLDLCATSCGLLGRSQAFASSNTGILNEVNRNALGSAHAPQSQQGVCVVQVLQRMIAKVAHTCRTRSK